MRICRVAPRFQRPPGCRSISRVVCRPVSCIKGGLECGPATGDTTTSRRSMLTSMGLTSALTVITCGQ
jgi:hypothetical protein